eukprot:TRINITY_DN3976_c0_g3_i1.p1 TRINITY_DN3976_c0_g3~~TRINITY_DN3976_c0_g3_i1.p1  ORF type:complete len:393 (+),score=43.36 TRINITY_DN3976_c0_g3_i1:145-1323(+)
MNFLIRRSCCSQRSAPTIALRGFSTIKRTLQATERFGEAERARRKEKLSNKRSVEGIENVPSFQHVLLQHNLGALRKAPTITTLQVNIGLTCNMACNHCHVESNPSRSETMNRETVERVVDVLSRSETIDTVDITGGAPEMHREFPFLVEESRKLGKKVIDRCNLTVLKLPGYESLASYLADNGVDIVASMPCYSPENVDAQRGEKTFDQSIEALQTLNSLGYGRLPHLPLDLVYNPGGAFLPPEQEALEATYKTNLKETYDIDFSNLYCITNMPIKRFADSLRESGELSSYMHLLADSFNPGAVDGVMCKNQVHVSYSGSISDCDFNYALEIPSHAAVRKRYNMKERQNVTVHDLENYNELASAMVGVGQHCFGCTAGSGSSCGGALLDAA